MLLVACALTAACVATPEPYARFPRCLTETERLVAALHDAINVSRVDSGRQPVAYRTDSTSTAATAELSPAPVVAEAYRPRPARNRLTFTFASVDASPARYRAAQPITDCSVLVDAIVAAMLQDVAHAANVLAPEARTVRIVVRERPGTDTERRFTVDLLFDW